MCFWLIFSSCQHEEAMERQERQRREVGSFCSLFLFCLFFYFSFLFNILICIFLFLFQCDFLPSWFPEESIPQNLAFSSLFFENIFPSWKWHPPMLPAHDSTCLLLFCFETVSHQVLSPPSSGCSEHWLWMAHCAEDTDPWPLPSDSSMGSNWSHRHGQICQRQNTAPSQLLWDYGNMGNPLWPWKQGFLEGRALEEGLKGWLGVYEHGIPKIFLFCSISSVTSTSVCQRPRSSPFFWITPPRHLLSFLISCLHNHLRNTC